MPLSAKLESYTEWTATDHFIQRYVWTLSDSEGPRFAKFTTYADDLDDILESLTDPLCRECPWFEPAMDSGDHVFVRLGHRGLEFSTADGFECAFALSEQDIRSLSEAVRTELDRREKSSEKEQDESSEDEQQARKRPIEKTGRQEGLKRRKQQAHAKLTPAREAQEKR